MQIVGASFGARQAWIEEGPHTSVGKPDLISGLLDMRANFLPFLVSKNGYFIRIQFIFKLCCFRLEPVIITKNQYLIFHRQVTVVSATL